MAPELCPHDRLAAIAKLEKKPTKQAFSWVFDEVDRHTVLENGAPVIVETPVERERIVTRTVVECDKDGRPIVEYVPPSERVVTRPDDKGKLRVVFDKKGEPLRETIPGRWQEKTREEVVIEELPDTWAEDLAAAGIKDGPEATAYMHTEAMDYVVAFPGEDGVHRFAARDEPQLIEMIREHLAGYPGLKAKVAEWRAGRGVPSADIIEEARNANPELFSNTEAVDPEKEALRDQVADLQRQLAERDAEPPPLSPDPVKHMIPDEIRKLMLDDETLPQARQRLWPVLNAELSELKNQEALFNRTEPRRAEVEQLISILARLGEG